MQLPVLTFSGLLEQMAAGVQGAATQLIDLTIGSVLRAILESCASVALWLQWLNLQVLAMTRAATSAGSDLDSWMADYAFFRLQGAPANGVVTFARYVPGITTTIAVGTVVLTADGGTSFAVVADDSNPAWNGLSGYVLAAAQYSVSVPVVCTLVGSAGNVLAGAIVLISSPIVGVDTINNQNGLTGGLAAEADGAFRTRFLNYINSRSLATVAAIVAAAEAVQLGVRALVLENVNPALIPQSGSFLVVADDGSGALSGPLLAAIQVATDAVRPIGSIFSVQPPIAIPAVVNVVLETSNPLTSQAVSAAVQLSIESWIQGLPIGGILALSKVDALAHEADASVLSVTSTLINGAASDLLAPINGVILPMTITVS